MLSSKLVFVCQFRATVETWQHGKGRVRGATPQVITYAEDAFRCINPVMKPAT